MCGGYSIYMCVLDWQSIICGMMAAFITLVLIWSTIVQLCTALRTAFASDTVVVSAAVGYDLNTFKRFVVPLRKVYSGDVVLFVSNPPSDVIELCNKNRIVTRKLPPQKHLTLTEARFFGYSKVCQDYSLCFATDFRDVFFQGNPFDGVPTGYDIILSEEFSKIRIATCPYNSNWIKSCWGSGTLQQIGKNSPICAGTLMGTPRGFKELINAFVHELRLIRRFPGCVPNDQGILNFLYYTKKLSVPVLVQPRGSGVVNTVGYIQPRSTIGNYLTLDGWVKNDNGSLSAVVHQYDRFPELERVVQSLLI